MRRLARFVGRVLRFLNGERWARGPLPTPTQDLTGVEDPEAAVTPPTSSLGPPFV